MTDPHALADAPIPGPIVPSRSPKARRRPSAAGRTRRRDRVAPRLEWLEVRTLLSSTPTIISVTSNADTGTGTLRAAIQSLDSSNASLTIIQFKLPLGELTITPKTALPAITAPVEIEGSSQTEIRGAPPVVVISGSSAPQGSSGLTLAAGSSGSIIEGLVINQFASGDGLDLASSNDLVTDCDIGTTAGGGSAAGNEDGIAITAAGAGCTIGGSASGDANIISGNANYGIEIGASSCLVQGNGIGTNATDSAPLGNKVSIYVHGTGATIGGSASGDANIISGNTGYGIDIEAASCLVEGDLIGTNTAAYSDIGNKNGIYVDGAEATIGGSASGDANTIAGNEYDGINIEAASCLVEGNWIGTNAAGYPAIPNNTGIYVDGTGATIGGSASGDANTISGNQGDGIDIEAASCLVEGNWIGTNPSGSTGIGNNEAGIYVQGTGATIGGSAAGDANIICGNLQDGIDIEAESCLVEGNWIGTNPAGSAAIANRDDGGIYVGATGATIGGSAAGDANTISGNTKYGIDIEAASCLVEGDMIGTNAAGSARIANGEGIYVNATGATIGGTVSGDANTIAGNGSGGLYLASDAASCLVEGNLIGTNTIGSANIGNGFGIGVDGSGATIGGTAQGAANTIAGNDDGDGIDIEGGATSSLVEGNWIGTNEAGSAIPNSYNGIHVEGTGTTIGGTVAGAANTIAGNQEDLCYGIDVEVACLVEGNWIGTNASGATNLGNGVGIFVEGFATGATIGGTAQGAANTIAGNAGGGIDIGASCLVEGNWIGTNASGATDIGNGDGIEDRATGGTIGGTAPGDANTIAGNKYNDIDISGSLGLVEGNWIGTNEAGSSDFTTGIGIYVDAGESRATIGGSAAGAANTIAGNADDGIDIAGTSCLVEGNWIGTNASGATDIGNGGGIIVDGPGATIGGTATGAGNVISGNDRVGIDINDPCLVEGNRIGTDATGTDPVPNQGGGIFVGSTLTGEATIGAAGGGNVIAFNGGPGVAVAPDPTGTVTIRYNSIFENAGPGIDLGDDGVTPDTYDDPDNSPVLSPSSGGILSGSLNAAPDSTYIIDFYANPSSDASATRPQGRTDLGSTTIVTDAQGNGSFTFPFTPDAFESFVTATATAASGTTSEFSAPEAYAAPARGLTFNATAGVPFQGEVAAFTAIDPSATPADFTATINYGDGTPSTAGTVVAGPDGFVVLGSHTFAAADPADPVTVTITDSLDNLQATAQSLADVAGPSDVVTAYGRTANFVAGTLYSAVVASFTDSNVRAIAGQFTATINWGDGSAPSVGTISIDGAGFDVNGSHTYNFAGTDAITVTIDDLPTSTTVTAAATATVAPVSITIQPRNFAVTPGVAYSGVLATFTDSDPLTSPGFYTATINWGDGTPNTTGTISGSNPFTVTASHTFNTFDQGTDIVTITITDPNGQTAAAVARAVDPPAATDPSSTGPATTLSPAPTPSPAPAPTSSPAATPSPAPAATPTVALAVQAGNIKVPQNGVFRGVVATFTDGGPTEVATSYRATVAWGKGRKAAGMITGSNGRFVVSARHAFPRFRGTRPVTITVTDPDGQTVSVTESASEVARHARIIKVAGRARADARSHR